MIRRRADNGKKAEAKKDQSHADLARAEVSLEVARAARQRQEALKEQEHADWVQRMDRLAGSDGNHLGRLVLQALTERFGNGKR